jgi:hypothetical protein
MPTQEVTLASPLIIQKSITIDDVLLKGGYILLQKIDPSTNLSVTFNRLKK